MSCQRKRDRNGVPIRAGQQKPQKFEAADWGFEFFIPGLHDIPDSDDWTAQLTAYKSWCVLEHTSPAWLPQDGKMLKYYFAQEFEAAGRTMYQYRHVSKKESLLLRQVGPDLLLELTYNRLSANTGRTLELTRPLSGAKYEAQLIFNSNMRVTGAMLRDEVARMAIENNEITMFQKVKIMCQGRILGPTEVVQVASTVEGQAANRGRRLSANAGP
jgi:hypothetical protein